MHGLLILSESKKKAVRIRRDADGTFSACYMALRADSPNVDGDVIQLKHFASPAVAEAWAVKTLRLGPYAK